MYRKRKAGVGRIGDEKIKGGGIEAVAELGGGEALYSTAVPAGFERGF
jgi:hypothetical protein